MTSVDPRYLARLAEVTVRIEDTDGDDDDSDYDEYDIAEGCDICGAIPHLDGCIRFSFD